MTSHPNWNIVLLVGVLVASAALANDDKPRPRSDIAAKRAADAPAVNKEPAQASIDRVAQSVGLETCKPAIDKVTNYLVGNSRSGGELLAATQNANSRVASVSIEVENAQAVAYASATYAPYGPNGCGVSYDAVTYLKESCSAFASKSLKGLKYAGTLGNKIAVFEGGPRLKFFLMPAGAGCIQIKKEVIH